ncbi:tetratricopeptide repeat protein [Muricoccus radiodurans]|uniref:tetratricopeptide repeat protein n=1 Tax=Muricoccus radiodurans TaxID=2231721 RepID=UPI003CF5FF5A
MTTDSLGNPLSCAPNAVPALERATDKLHAYQADPIADVDALLEEHPDCVMALALRAGALATALDKAFEPELRATLEKAEPLLPIANDRERGHLAASRRWSEGDFSGAVETWGRVAIEHPRDLLATQLAQIGDFALGQSQMLRDRVARVLPHWGQGMPGRGYVLGMHAFGLEECGQYDRAEAAGREGLSLNPQDGWAAHAVAHVLEMTGRAEEGAAFLRGTSAGWHPNSMFAYHNWWHLALFHLERRDTDGALRLYDEAVSFGGFVAAQQMVDASALLWRVWLMGADVGDRWTALAADWRTRIDHGYMAFNDLHAMMAFIGAGDVDAQAALLSNMERTARAVGGNGMMTRDVGLPACRGFAAFGRGDYAGCLEALLPIRGIANRFGGSHAQRDILSWTLTEAAIRMGHARMAETMAAERLAAKPESPLNLAWARRATVLTHQLAA